MLAIRSLPRFVDAPDRLLGRAMRIRDFIKLARPRDWLKNVFVLMPVPFALAAGGHLEPVSFVLGVAALSLASSAVYALNDTLDAERDRLHEKKRERPIAAGRISKTEALVFAGGAARRRLRPGRALGLGGRAPRDRGVRRARSCSTSWA